MLFFRKICLEVFFCPYSCKKVKQIIVEKCNYLYFYTYGNQLILNAMNTVFIKLPPHLIAFLKLQAKEPKQPLRFGAGSVFNTAIISGVVKYPFYGKNIPKEEEENSRNYFASHKAKGGVFCVIPNSIKASNCNYFPEDAHKRFKIFVNQVFYMELLKFLIELLMKGVSREEALEKFMEHLNLGEDDICKNTLYRQSSRILEDLNIRKKEPLKKELVMNDDFVLPGQTSLDLGIEVDITEYQIGRTKFIAERGKCADCYFSGGRHCKMLKDDNNKVLPKCGKGIIFRKI